MIFYYLVIILCGLLILCHVRQHARKISGRVKETSKQITTVLALQVHTFNPSKNVLLFYFKALLPLFFTYAPSLYIKLTNLFGSPSTFFDSIHFSLLIGMFYPWMSVANPMISIVFIGRYRQVGFKEF